jgi:threonine/homoserine/homoserine lactone efflux protein
MNAEVLLRGLVLGFSIAAPVGPIGLLCIRRTLALGRAHGLATGLGAATADAFYGMVAAFSLAVVASILNGIQTPLRLLGGAFLCYLGVRTFRARVANEAAAGVDTPSMLGSYVSTVFLTLTNPATIFAFAAMFAGMGATDAPFALVAGVFAGSALWWLLLSTITSLFRRAVDERAMIWINRFSGVLLVGFGLFAMASLFAPR